MSKSPSPRRPLKVVVIVAAFWIGGTILQTAVAWAVATSGLVSADSASTVGIVLGWGLLFLVSLAFREPLDAWLRA